MCTVKNGCEINIEQSPSTLANFKMGTGVKNGCIEKSYAILFIFKLQNVHSKKWAGKKYRKKLSNTLHFQTSKGSGLKRFRKKERKTILTTIVHET